MADSRANTIRMTFFGDSICFGQGVSLYKGWVTKIAQDLDELGQSLGREVLVTNASVNGRTTRQALEDMPYQVQSHGVDILLVQFGLNDCNYWMTDKGLPRVSRAAYIANLIEIIERGKRAGARRILLSNNHPTGRYKEIMANTSITYEDSNRSYNEAVREVAAAMAGQVLFTDIERIFRDEVASGRNIEELLLADGLHLNLEGHAIYVSALLPLLRSAVTEIAGA